MYFGFLGFYSMCLVPPVLLVVVFALSGAHEQTKNTVFAILNLVLGTVFLEAWKRRCSEISFRWGTLKSGIGEWMSTFICSALSLSSWFTVTLLKYLETIDSNITQHMLLKAPNWQEATS